MLYPTRLCLQMNAVQDYCTRFRIHSISYTNPNLYYHCYVCEVKFTVSLNGKCSMKDV